MTQPAIQNAADLIQAAMRLGELHQKHLEQSRILNDINVEIDRIRAGFGAFYLESLEPGEQTITPADQIVFETPPAKTVLPPIQSTLKVPVTPAPQIETLPPATLNGKLLEVIKGLADKDKNPAIAKEVMRRAVLAYGDAALPNIKAEIVRITAKTKNPLTLENASSRNLDFLQMTALWMWVDELDQPIDTVVSPAAPVRLPAATPTETPALGLPWEDEGEILEEEVVHEIVPASVPSEDLDGTIFALMTELAERGLEARVESIKNDSGYEDTDSPTVAKIKTLQMLEELKGEAA